MAWIIAITIAFLSIILLILLINRSRKNNRFVLSYSKKIWELEKLNKEIGFKNVKSFFECRKHYDNKTYYNKIEPQYLMTNYIEENLKLFKNLIDDVKYNKEKLIEYKKKVEQIIFIVTQPKDINLKFSYNEFIRRENKLFINMVLTPTVNVTFKTVMTYSSPQRRVNLSKERILNFADIETCFNSLSRSTLDKSVYVQNIDVIRGDVTDSLRYDILKRDNFKCVICGASASSGARLHVDHIIPVSKGGKSTPDNLRTLCARCNVGKSNKIEIENSKETNKKHKEDLICEQCGAKLVLRNGKNGEFYGCSNYPKCKFTKNI